MNPANWLLLLTLFNLILLLTSMKSHFFNSVLPFNKDQQMVSSKEKKFFFLKI